VIDRHQNHGTQSQEIGQAHAPARFVAKRELEWELHAELLVEPYLTHHAVGLLGRGRRAKSGEQSDADRKCGKSASPYCHGACFGLGPTPAFTCVADRGLTAAGDSGLADPAPGEGKPDLATMSMARLIGM